MCSIPLAGSASTTATQASTRTGVLTLTTDSRTAVTHIVNPASDAEFAGITLRPSGTRNIMRKDRPPADDAGHKHCVAWWTRGNCFPNCGICLITTFSPTFTQFTHRLAPGLCKPCRPPPTPPWLTKALCRKRRLAEFLANATSLPTLAGALESFLRELAVGPRHLGARDFFSLLQLFAQQ